MTRFTPKPLAHAIGVMAMAGGLYAASAQATTAPEFNARFALQTGAANPFSAIDSYGSAGYGIATSVVLTDLDADGDLDVVVLHQNGGGNDAYGTYGVVDYDAATSVWENTGSAGNPSFTEVPDSAYNGYGEGNIQTNPFVGEFDSAYGHPVTAADLDDDGDDDFLIGHDFIRNGNYEFRYYEVANSYGEVTGIDAHYFGATDGYGYNPLFGDYLGDSGYGAGPAFVDIDNDGDLDLFSTNGDEIQFFRNNGSPDAAGSYFAEVTGPDNPFYNLSISASLYSGHHGAPIAFGDLDGDGDQDMVMGTTTSGANVRLFVNTGNASVPSFEEILPANEPFGTAMTIYEGAAFPTLADIDADGDIDVLISVSNNPVKYLLRNVTGESAEAGLTVAEVAILLEEEKDKDDDSGFLGSTGLFGLLSLGLAGLLRRRRK